MPFHKRNEQDTPLSASQLDENNQLVEDLYNASSSASDTAVNAKNEAVAARDAAVMTGAIYESTAEGLANTSDGEYFSIVSGSYNGFIDLWLNDGGVAVDQEKTYKVIVPKPVTTPSIIADFVNQEYKLAGDYGLEDATFSGMFAFSRASSATRINHKKQVDTRAANEHRVQYDYDTGEALGIRIESSVTNKILYSSQIDNAAWIKVFSGIASAPVVTANYGIAPDGTTTADRVVFNLNGGTSAVDQSNLLQVISGTIGQRRESHVWLKTIDGSEKNMRLDFSGVSSDIGDSSDITITGDWKKFRVGLTSQIDAARYPYLRLRGAVGTDDSADLLVWGWNLYDNFAGPTSDIETTASQATRLSDSCTRDISSEINNNNSGAFFFEFIAPEPSLTGNRIFRLSKNGDSVNNRLTIAQGPNLESIEIIVGSSGNYGGNFPIGSYAAGSKVKIACSFDSENISMYVNGTKYSSSFLPSQTNLLDFIDIGQEGGTKGNTSVSTFKYYPSMLTDDELRGLTS